MQQTATLALGKSETAIAFLTGLGCFIESRYFNAGKEALGLTVMLQGQGMCFTRESLQAVPWRASSLVEDTEHTLCLLRHGERVHFRNDVVVWTEMPSEEEQLRTQRSRWAGGTMKLARRSFVPLLMEGVVKRDIRIIDYAITFLTANRPLGLFIAGLSLVSSCLALLGVPDSNRIMIALVAACPAIFMALYLSTAAISMEGGLVGIRRLFGGAWWGFRMLLITLAGFTGRDKEWKRTDRDG